MLLLWFLEFFSCSVFFSELQQSFIAALMRVLMEVRQKG